MTGVPVSSPDGKRQRMKLRTPYTCPLEMTHDIICGKWKPIIL